MKIIATDLDRTLIPNGNHKPEKGSMQLFKNLLKKNKILLIFITGRPLYLIKDAIKRYKLPSPNYIIAMLGTKIYKYQKKKIIEDKEWNLILSKKRFNLFSIEKVFKKFPDAKIQAKKFQNQFKLSYNIKNYSVIPKIKKELKKLKIQCNLIISFDIKRKVWMIDILNPLASKKLALFFLLKKLKFKKKILFSGDSGNDLDLIVSKRVYGILVNNVSKEVKEQLLKKIKKEKLKNIYLAKGNYVYGIIEGAKHFKIFN